jgi:hypothetical protein
VAVWLLRERWLAGSAASVVGTVQLLDGMVKDALEYREAVPHSAGGTR